MPTIPDKCNQLCNDTLGYELINRVGYKNMIEIASKLARCLLSTNAVNTIWNCSNPRSGQETIISFLRYLDEELIGELLTKGLDLNNETSHGVLPFNWMIGNAENDFVNKILGQVENYQDIHQRLIWINKTDSMLRYEKIDDESIKLCYGLFSNYFNIIESQVKQTPLQLVIAKGYKGVNGSGFLLAVSNLQLAEKLLRLGANIAVDYQELTKGNTALHIAYARRDYNAIKLLEEYGASQQIVNSEGATPADMLSLTFNQAEKLMVFHTSPHGHTNTFRLDKEEFQNQQNLENIQKGIKIGRRLFAIRDNDTTIFVPFTQVERAALNGDYYKVSSLINAGENLKKTRESLRYKLDLLNFMMEDASLHLKKMAWLDYYSLRKEIDNQLNGFSNPYMYDLDEKGYTEFQDYQNNNEDEFKATTEKNIRDLGNHIAEVDKALKLLDKVKLKEAALTGDNEAVAQLTGTGINPQIIIQSIEQELKSLHFNQVMGSILLSLCRNEMVWADYYTQIEAAYNRAGGSLNPYLPPLGNHINETEYAELQVSIKEYRKEYENELVNGEITHKIANKIIKYENTLKLITQLDKPKKNLLDAEIENASAQRLPKRRFGQIADFFIHVFNQCITIVSAFKINTKS